MPKRIVAAAIMPETIQLSSARPALPPPQKCMPARKLRNMNKVPV
jgi:hypothetical protein